MLRASVLFLLPVAVASAEGLHWSQSGFDASAAGWTKWSPREEIAPKMFVDTRYDLGDAGALAISGSSNAAAYGAWERRFDGIAPGQWFRFQGHYRSEGVSHRNLRVVARLDWIRADGKRAGQPEYGYRESWAGDWRKVIIEAPAPERAVAVKIQLFLQNEPQGTVWWDQLSLEQVKAPAPRPVKVASVNFRPSRSASSAESVAKFIELSEKQVPAGTDVILLPEGVTIVSTGKKYADVAESVPGPTTAKLGELARAKNAWVVAGLYEREGATLYNTAVLIDRKGQFAGKYRKVYLPREEVEGGLTPGSEYPVFRTDFGTVGVMICWDLQYADPARALALRGAELLLVPIWGGNEVLGKARVIENRVFLASSGYDYPTYVMDPDGEVLSQARQNGTVAYAQIDLARRYADEWLGDMRGRFFKELRTDVAAGSGH
ncbi:MAG: carbon-nitrogen hydrolase family protein [Bryobacteraceae bacterium]